ncbi:MAG: glycosyltransferase [Turicibacter sp.]|nr:glycosyltransferase [Turicibacter sp.]
MQATVSIVTTCYNKEKDIANMFDSVIAQKWDNIQVILVNDGSTDKTGDIIKGYESKFTARGYEVIIIEQENKGVEFATLVGLKRATGDFICFPDCDDELDPEFVSLQAEFLSSNRNYKITACDGLDICGNSKTYRTIFPYLVGNEPILILEDYILWKITSSHAFYMIANSYLKECRVEEFYYSKRFGNQEQQIMIPLVAKNPLCKYFRKPLYKRIRNLNDLENHQSHRNAKNYSTLVEFFTEFYNCQQETINKLDIDNKNELLQLSNLSKWLTILKYTERYKDVDNLRREIFKQLFDEVNNYLDIPISYQTVSKHSALFYQAVNNNVIGIEQKHFATNNRRIIAWGALGGNAKNILPYCKGTNIEPTELWDMNGDDVSVKKPNVDLLQQNDIVLILPTSNKEIIELLQKSKVKDYMTYEEVCHITALKKFPELREKLKIGGIK